MRTLERMWRDFAADNWIELEINGGRIFRIGPVGVLIIMAVQAVMIGWLVGWILAGH